MVTKVGISRFDTLAYPLRKNDQAIKSNNRHSKLSSALKSPHDAFERLLCWLCSRLGEVALLSFRSLIRFHEIGLDKVRLGMVMFAKVRNGKVCRDATKLRLSKSPTFPRFHWNFFEFPWHFQPTTVVIDLTNFKGGAFDSAVVYTIIYVSWSLEAGSAWQSVSARACRTSNGYPAAMRRPPPDQAMT